MRTLRASFPAIVLALAAARPAPAQGDLPLVDPADDAPRPVEAAPPEMQATLDNLRVTLEFHDTPLDDVVEFVRQIASLNILVDPSVRERHGPDPIKVTLAVKSLPLRSALNLVLEPRGLTLAYRDGVLLVLTRDQANKTTATELYDVRDLLMPIRDFPGPEISLAALAEQRPGVLFNQPEGPGGFTDDFIVNMVKTHCGKGTWDADDRASATLHNGLLVVTQSPAVHRQVQALLAKLRANK